ncbi:pentapeptide repeat-containing protein [Aliiroseovarius marinus]|uniref:pentapeptide repeat-containing protein n=1 Tax=Aliiroseovarius marinus TaxID=2500159 RepID=UPI003D7E3B64
MSDRNKTTLNWFGYQIPLGMNENKPLGVFLGFLLAILAIVAGLMLVGAVAMIFGVFFGEAQTTDLRGPAMMFAAIIGFPLVVWRSVVAQKQTDHAGDVLFNDKLNEAVQYLHAQRQVTVEDDKGEKFNAWEDDIIRRNGAIDRLEALAVERPAYAPRIARMLCVYLKEMSKEYPAKEKPKKPNDAKIWLWTKSLKVSRSDMESAAQVLGRLHYKTGVPPKELAIDLSGANLQAMRLIRSNFSGANLANIDADAAMLHGSDLTSSWLDGASLTGAWLIGAKLRSAGIGVFSDMRGIRWNMASLRQLNLGESAVKADQIGYGFGDASVKLPKDMERPNWPDTVLDDATYEAEYALFLKDPDAYIPPQDRNA